MDALSLLAAARSAGMAVSADDGRLVVRGPRSAEELALQLLDRKDEILLLLRPAAPPDFGDDPGPHNSQDSHNSPSGLRERVFEAARRRSFPPIRLPDKRRCRGEDRWRLLLFSPATTEAELVRLLMRLGSPTLDEPWDDDEADRLRRDVSLWYVRIRTWEHPGSRGALALRWFDHHLDQGEDMAALREAHARCLAIQREPEGIPQPDDGR